MPFLSELFEIGTKNECTFVIATHDLALPVATPKATVLMLHSCEWEGTDSPLWNYEQLDSSSLQENSSLTEDLKIAILGAREKILFVEGNSSSLDRQLYTTLFPNITVVAKGSSQEVEKSVRALRDTKSWHHVEVFGLIDRDNKNDAKVAALKGDNIFTLDTYSVESLYYCSESIKAVAHYQAEDFGMEAQTLSGEAIAKALSDLQKSHIKENLVCQQTNSQIQHYVRSQIPPIVVDTNNLEKISVDIKLEIPAYLRAAAKKYDDLVQAGDYDELIARLPLHKSNVLNNIAKSLKCHDRQDYQRTLLRQLREDEKLRCVFKKRLSPLSEQLEQS